jgi:hypothetical protein
MLRSREEDVKPIFDDQWDEELALSVEHKHLTIITLSYGGPSDYLEVTHDGEGTIEKVIYRFSDWFDTSTVVVPEDSPLWGYAQMFIY